MFTSRGLLLCVPVLLLAVSAAPFLMYPALPHPAQATRAELGKWLVLRDIPKADESLRRALLDRLQDEFSSGPSPREDLAQLNSGLQQRLRKNLDYLKEFWFHARVNDYYRLAKEKQRDFLDRQIAFAGRWSEFDPDANETDVFDQIDEWLAEAAGDARARLEDALRDAVTRFLATRTLEDQSPKMRRELALRIAEDLAIGTRFASRLDDLSEAENQRLWANAELLMEAWILQQSESYWKTAEAQRAAFLDRRIDEFEQWDLLQFFRRDGEVSEFEALSEFSRKTQGWLARAEKKQRGQLQQLLQDVTQRLLTRRLQQATKASTLK